MSFSFLKASFDIGDFSFECPLDVKARQGHVGGQWSDTEIIVFGGRGTTKDQRRGPRTYLNDVWVCNLLSGVWTQQSLKVAPDPRHNHAGIVWNRQLFVFGGSGNAGFLDDMWCFDGEEWRKMQKSGAWPSARHAHAASLVEIEGKPFFLIQGGHCGRQKEGPTYCGDMWAFDLLDGGWTALSLSGGPVTQRSWHQMVFLERGVVIAFGYTWKNRQEVYFGDLWYIPLDIVNGGLRAEAWVQLRGPEQIARNRVAMCRLSDTTLFSYGGNEFDGNDDTFHALPTLFTLDLARSTFSSTLLAPVDAYASQPKLGHAIAIALDESHIAIVCGERNRRRLASTQILHVSSTH